MLNFNIVTRLFFIFYHKKCHLKNAVFVFGSTKNYLYFSVSLLLILIINSRFFIYAFPFFPQIIPIRNPSFSCLELLKPLILLSTPGTTTAPTPSKTTTTTSTPLLILRSTLHTTLHIILLTLRSTLHTTLHIILLTLRSTLHTTLHTILLTLRSTLQTTLHIILLTLRPTFHSTLNLNSNLMVPTLLSQFHLIVTTKSIAPPTLQAKLPLQVTPALMTPRSPVGFFSLVLVMKGWWCGLMILTSEFLKTNRTTIPKKTMGWLICCGGFFVLLLLLVVLYFVVFSGVLVFFLFFFMKFLFFLAFVFKPRLFMFE